MSSKMATLPEELDTMSRHWLRMPSGRNERDFLSRIGMVLDLTELTVPLARSEGWSLDVKFGRCCAR